MTKPKKTHAQTAPARTTFRHGDLRAALLVAGVELARSSGPAGVILREATRRAGVAPNAAYRHFSSHAELLAAVRAHALSQLARAIEAEIAAIPPRRRGAALARAHLRAVGIGYLTFALRQPGLFRTAFSSMQPVVGDSDKAKAGASGLNPFQLLSRALDLMVLHRLLLPRRRSHAEYLAWSAVHGLAFLVIDGPLHTASPAEIATLSERLILMVEKGLSS
jgi:AcrR family transcriptional regulator